MKTSLSGWRGRGPGTMGGRSGADWLEEPHTRHSTARASVLRLETEGHDRTSFPGV